MVDDRKRIERHGKAQALRELVRNLRAADLRLTSASAIQECLRGAHAN
jgi:hypothetical protein